mmetsp:Transcript_8761/g.24735  ORF Transcript_8761/g.24735 Transcript_8761/m.24735 type:complete len:275 (+) Transcript_8761:629-1453(+)
MLLHVPLRAQQQLHVDLHLLDFVAVGAKHPLADVQRLSEGALGASDVLPAQPALLVRSPGGSARSAGGEVHQADADGGEGRGALGRVLAVQLPVVDEGAVVGFEGEGPLAVLDVDGSRPGVEEGHLGRGRAAVGSGATSSERLRFVREIGAGGQLTDQGAGARCQTHSSTRTGILAIAVVAASQRLRLAGRRTELTGHHDGLLSVGKSSGMGLHVTSGGVSSRNKGEKRGSAFASFYCSRLVLVFQSVSSLRHSIKILDAATSRNCRPHALPVY